MSPNAHWLCLRVSDPKFIAGHPRKELCVHFLLSSQTWVQLELSAAGLDVCPVNGAGRKPFSTSLPLDGNEDAVKIDGNRVSLF